MDLYSKSEYLFTFNAIIYGLVCAEYFHGWGELLRKRGIVKAYIPHLLWTIFTFLLLVDIWWGHWEKSLIITSGINYFYGSLLTPGFLYLLSISLFPGKLETHDLEKFYWKNKRSIFLLFIALFSSNLFADFFFGENIIDDMDTYFRISAIFFSVIAIITLNRTYHIILIYTSVILLIVHHVLLTNNPVESNLIIEGYSKSEYLITFYSIIFGYVVFEFFTGWGKFVRNMNKITFCFEHLLLTIFCFSLMVSVWWISWVRVEAISTNIFFFNIVLLTPLIFYLGGCLLFPDLSEKKNYNLVEYFYKNKNLIYIIFSCYFLANILISYVFEEYIYFPNENYYRIVGVILPAVGIFIQNRWYHKSLAVFAFGIQLAHHIYIYK